MLYSLPVIQEQARLVAGNSKLGSGIYVWSLPAALTCPGRTELCTKLCYALKHRFATATYLWHVMVNWLLACTPLFAVWMTRRLLATRVAVVRIHVSGDFFSAAYVRQWIRIVEALPLVSFYAYTRSWRATDPALRDALKTLSQMPNVQLWYSVDKESKCPTLTDEERRVRLAYLSTAEDDVAEGVDLVFRDYPARGVVHKYQKGALVCPEENGTGVHVSCSNCGVCWKPPVANAKRTRRTSSDITLQAK